jgi:hypothetical protein
VEQQATALFTSPSGNVATLDNMEQIWDIFEAAFKLPSASSSSVSTSKIADVCASARGPEVCLVRTRVCFSVSACLVDQCEALSVRNIVVLTLVLTSAAAHDSY